MEKIYVKYGDALEEAMHFRKYGDVTRILENMTKEIRLDTLRQVLPKKEWFIYLQESLDDLSREQLEENSVRVGINTCIDKIEAKAKELWGIDLIN